MKQVLPVILNFTFKFHNLQITASRTLLTVLAFMMLSPLHSEEKYFSSGDETTYLEKIEAIFKASSEKKLAKEYLEQFESFWLSPSTPDRAKDIIIEISDVLYNKNGRAFPDYHLFLTTMQAFVEQDQINGSFTAWHKSAMNLFKQPRYPLRHFNQLLETTKDIVTEQKIFSTPGVEWYSRSPHYQFTYTDDTLRLTLKSTSLVCHSRNDSIVVFDTGGTLDIITGQWKGRKGRITWERSGFESNKVYALFDDYTLNMGKSDFEVENATFHNLFYFSEPLKGHLEHKVMSIRTPSSSNYPKFESYDQIFRINNIHPNMHYQGGFSQHGAKFRGSGTNENPATISIFRNEKLFISAKSLVFSLREEEILSRNTEITIHLDTGKIHHPGLEFKYMVPGKKLFLFRSGEGISKSPFFDSYHNVSIDSEIIQWDLDNDYMELRMLKGAASNRSFFESTSFYRESFFNYLQGMDAIHPLQGLRNCYIQHKNQPFTALEYSRFINMPESQVRQQIIELSFHGFVDFNPNTDTVKIQDRLTNYLKFRFGKKDYDVIRFKSVTPGQEPNAILDLKNYDLALNGVKNISISDHQNVIFLPKNQKVTLKYNRNFSFDGHIMAGMIELFGDGFFFSYEDFRIDMHSIDSLRMSVTSEKIDNYGRPLLRTIDNTVARLSGYLQIDTANNKSGLEDYSHFPVLVSDRNSYVYYDRPDIQQGAYSQENFYFELDPFYIDSINNLSKKNIVFDGKLVTNIFPELEDQLTVRNDYSLGFIKQSPPEGYAIYGRETHFTNEINLSNQGLKGNGRLDYLTSWSESKEFTFLPEETKGMAQKFEIEPQTIGVEYPDVQGKDIEISYLPMADTLMAENLDTEFNLFKKETTLNGSLSLSPNGIEGRGLLTMPKATLSSRKMALSHHALMADSAEFKLLAGENIDGVSFKTSDLIAQLDFEDRQGRFSSRDKGNKVEFTENRYIAYISEFSWNMDKNDIFMGASGSMGNRFISTHRRQDSLEFLAPMARYDIENSIIVASEVSNIDVADAQIGLVNGIVKIMKNAEMEPFDSTTIEIKDSKHSFKHAHVKVEGKYLYNGYGEYDFTNGDQKNYTLDFHNITVNDDAHTIARGSVPDGELLTFDRHFAYKGDINLTASEPLLTFDGGTQLLHRCSPNGPQEYVRFNAPIDPSNIMIPIGDNTVNYEREDIHHDIFLQIDSSHVYSAFLEKKRKINNSPIVSAKGFLRHNSEMNTFEIAQKEKLAHPDSAGNIIRFLEQDCIISGEGKLDPGLDLEQIKLHASGTINHFKSNNEVMINTLFGVDFMLDETSILTMTEGIKASKAKVATHKKKVIEKRLREWVTQKDANHIANVLLPATDISELLPEHIKHTLCFTDIEFRWDTPSRSYVADGPANLGWIKDRAVALQVDVKALISRSRGGNSFEIHIQADPETWFFYSYKNGKMLVLSSSETFNKGIQALDIDERKMKTGFGQDSYVFQLGSKNRLRSFMDFFIEPETEENIDAAIDDQDQPVNDNEEYSEMNDGIEKEENELIPETND